MADTEVGTFLRIWKELSKPQQRESQSQEWQDLIDNQTGANQVLNARFALGRQDDLYRRASTFPLAAVGNLPSLTPYQFSQAAGRKGILLAMQATLKADLKRLYKDLKPITRLILYLANIPKVKDYLHDNLDKSNLDKSHKQLLTLWETDPKIDFENEHHLLTVKSLVDEFTKIFAYESLIDKWLKDLAIQGLQLGKDHGYNTTAKVGPRVPPRVPPVQEYTEITRAIGLANLSMVLGLCALPIPQPESLPPSSLRLHLRNEYPKPDPDVLSKAYDEPDDDSSTMNLSDLSENLPVSKTEWCRWTPLVEQEDVTRVANSLTEVDDRRGFEMAQSVLLNVISTLAAESQVKTCAVLMNVSHTINVSELGGQPADTVRDWYTQPIAFGPLSNLHASPPLSSDKEIKIHKAPGLVKNSEFKKEVKRKEVEVAAATEEVARTEAKVAEAKVEAERTEADANIARSIFENEMASATAEVNEANEVVDYAKERANSQVEVAKELKNEVERRKKAEEAAEANKNVKNEEYEKAKVAKRRIELIVENKQANLAVAEMELRQAKDAQTRKELEIRVEEARRGFLEAVAWQPAQLPQAETEEKLKLENFDNAKRELVQSRRLLKRAEEAAEEAAAAAEAQEAEVAKAEEAAKPARVHYNRVKNSEQIADNLEAKVVEAVQAVQEAQAQAAKAQEAATNARKPFTFLQGDTARPASMPGAVQRTFVPPTFAPPTFVPPALVTSAQPATVLLCSTYKVDDGLTSNTPNGNQEEVSNRISTTTVDNLLPRDYAKQVIDMAIHLLHKLDLNKCELMAVKARLAEDDHSPNAQDELEVIKRRKIVWDDATRTAALSGDRLYSFYRQLSGTAGESMNAVVQIDDSQYQRDLVRSREQATKLSTAASERFSGLIESTFAGLFRQSGLTFAIGNPSTEVSIVSGNLRKQLTDLAQSEVGGLFQKSVELETLIESAKGKLSLSQLVQQLTAIGDVLQRSTYMAAYNPTSTLSIETVAQPSNSLVLSVRDVATAAVNIAYDNLERELQYHPHRMRLPLLYELIEGVYCCLDPSPLLPTPHLRKSRTPFHACPVRVPFWWELRRFALLVERDRT
jgi:hypothetical protein